MPSAENPYAPGAGTEPYRLPGRAEPQIWWRRCLTDLEALGHTSQRGRVYTGARGVGKTTLLRYCEREATERGFAVAAAQAGGSDRLRDYLTASLTELEHRTLGFTDKHGRLVELGMRVGPVEVSGARELADAGPRSPVETEFLELVDRVCRRYQAAGTGLVIMVDEAQDADVESLRSLCRVQHQLRRPAFQLLMAGLPSLEDAIDEAITHADRMFTYVELGNLDAAATREALLEPAAANGVRWTEAALDRAMLLSGGYPSFIQEYGFAIWNALGRSTVIDLEVVEAGAVQAQQVIARQFRSVWRASTRAGHEYLLALARLGGHARTARVAEALGRRPSELTMTLRTLKERGAVLSPTRGVITFSRPGMDVWLLENKADLLD